MSAELIVGVFGLLVALRSLGFSSKILKQLRTDYLATRVQWVAGLQQQIGATDWELGEDTRWRFSSLVLPQDTGLEVVDIKFHRWGANRAFYEFTRGPADYWEESTSPPLHHREWKVVIWANSPPKVQVLCRTPGGQEVTIFMNPKTDVIWVQDRWLMQELTREVDSLPASKK